MKDRVQRMELARPKVIYGESLKDSGVSYVVKVDEAILSELLREFGVPEKNIENLKVVVTRNGQVAGSYDTGASPFGFISENPEKVITLYTDWIWQEYQEKLKIAERITKRREKPKEQFKGMLTTKRLPRYLAVASTERGLTFADKLLRNAMQRDFNSILLHESKHAIDDSKHELWRRTFHEEAIVLGLPQIVFNIAYYQIAGRYLEDKPFLIFLGGLAWGMYIVNSLTYYVLGKFDIILNEVERSANRFTEEHKHQPRWYSIATIIPK